MLDLEDFLVSSLILPIGSLVILLFCTTKLGWGYDNYMNEVNTGKGIRHAIRFLSFILNISCLWLFYSLLLMV